MNQKSQNTRSFGPKSFVARRIAVLVAFLVMGGVLSTGWSLANAVLTPVNDPISAKIAEWARGHGLGSVVTGLEALQYRFNPPTVGGTPAASLLNSSDHVNNGISSGSHFLQNSIATLVTPSLPYEGKFKSLVSSHGIPIVQVAYLRPDALHTSYLSAIVWLSGKHARLEQHPGQSDPGHLSLWSKKTSIANSAATGLIATFNGGFKIKDSRGGYYENGHTFGAMTSGAASLVVYRDGSTAIGVWGRDVRMNAQVVSVRQNLQPLIEDGQIATNIDAAVRANWGTTVGASTNVWRSGIGTNAKGDLIYVVGDALSARSLATLLLRAGAVRAMQLDINKAWVSFMWFNHHGSADVLSPHKILNFQRPANRYFSATSRDFFAVYLR